ncbi:hypothetical protein A3860_37310 [Niastella vici]|uniref:DUF1648 domain-containing protein n=1 Tax=Niastella vici TaxID=1703345 RepID=A0A1V9FMB9_9BACT|nr:SdpI family protein [Niastella vici]OQP59499.1 hypothetical protein A3860_37310 [Niastella vici]
MTTINFRNIVRPVIVLGILAIPFIYLSRIYPSLPSLVPKHFNGEGIPDAYTAKHNLWKILALTSAIAVGIYLLLTNITRIDPKKKASLSRNTFQMISIVLVILIAALNSITIAASQDGHFAFSRFLPAILGLFLAFLGNRMLSIRPNYFVGIRTPWALEHEDNWKATHRLGGKVFFAGGILIVIVTFLLTPALVESALFAIIATMALIPVVYSYIYFRKHSGNNS